MALVVFDRVQETTATTGTGTITLAGAVVGFQSFAVVGDGNTTYYCIVNGDNWEVGIGTYSTTGPTLARTTVLSNYLGTTVAINLSGSSNVFVTYPSEKSVNLNAAGNVTPLGTISSGTWQGSTVGVAYGGTGVTASSGPNSVVLRDANGNITGVNNVEVGITFTTASGGTTNLTAASTQIQILTGSANHIFRLPDATTLLAGTFYTVSNASSGVLTIQDNAGVTLETVDQGGAAQVLCLSIGTSAGSWGFRVFAASNVTWGNANLDYNGTITSATWQGDTVEPAYGGTGLTTFSAANNALYSTGASTLTAGTLPILAGGTGATTAVGAMANLIGYTTTVTGGGTVTLTNASTYYQLFTGSSSQIVILPVTSTLQLGWSFRIINNSTSTLQVQSSGTNTLITLTNGLGVTVTCIATTGTGVASWEAGFTDFSTATGSGSVALSTAPSFSGISATGTLSITGSTSSAANFATSQTTANTTITTSQTSGTLTIGGTSGTGTQTIGQSTLSQTTNIQAGATASGSTKTMNIGTGGLTGSTTNINIGSAFGTTTTFNGTVVLPSGFSEFAAGTALLFYQAAAPTGWTQSTAHNNKALRIVSGTGGGSGGSVAFTTAFASQTPSGSVSTSISAISGTVSTSISAVSGSVGISGGSVSAHTLTTAQIPSHTHGYSGTTSGQSVDHFHSGSGGTGGQLANHTHAFTGNAVAANQAFLLGSGGQVTFGDTNVVNTTLTTSNDHTHNFSVATGGVSANHSHTFSGTTDGGTGGGGSHTHGFTNPTGSFTFSSGTASSSFSFSSGTASSSFTGSAINLAVQYIDVIVCTKN
jgi:hypothetical protein